LIALLEQGGRQFSGHRYPRSVKERTVNQFQLDRCVARATGESVEVVRDIGFTMLTPLANEFDEASRWLRRARRRRYFKNRHRRHRRYGRACRAS
jgi:hypothetical protein